MALGAALVAAVGLAVSTTASSAAPTPTVPDAALTSQAQPTMSHGAFRRLPSTTRTRATSAAGQVVVSCQQEAPPTCYGPDQLRAAYRIQPLLDHKITGKGRTIVVIAAYSPPDIRTDVNTYTAAFGLPTTDLTISAPQGATYDPANPEHQGWAAEMTADIELAHAVAPAAKIALVQAKSSDFTDILAATRWAVDKSLGDVISMSFISNEQCTPKAQLAAQHMLFQKATDKGITLVAGSGDLGAYLGSCDQTALAKATGTPASDPLVLAVGGTSLDADAVTGAYRSETAWNEPSLPGFSGGGYSTVFNRPSYQNGFVTNRGRGVPDVAYDAAFDGGSLVYIGGWGIFYGTSAGTPQWAGLTALADQAAGHRLGTLAPTLYKAAAKKTSIFYKAVAHDVTTGSSTFAAQLPDGSIQTFPGYDAGPGWDAVTGLGTPRADGLVVLLAAAG